MKKKSSKKYNLSILPGNKKYISKKIIVFSLGLIIIGAVALGFITGKMFHYKDAYLKSQQTTFDVAKYKRERDILVSKVFTLEKMVRRTKRLSAKIDNEETQWMSVFNNKDFLADPENINLNLEIDKLLSSASDSEQQINTFILEQQNRMFYWASMPSVWPTKGWITSRFGEQRTYRTSTGGRHTRFHDGIDIAAPRGTPIKAPAEGYVTYAGYSSGYGKLVKVDHGNGMITFYGHCSKIFVKEGDIIKRGMLLAYTGNTGRSTGPHLHYEIRIDDIPVNPVRFIVDETI